MSRWILNLACICVCRYFCDETSRLFEDNLHEYTHLSNPILASYPLPIQSNPLVHSTRGSQTWVDSWFLLCYSCPWHLRQSLGKLLLRYIPMMVGHIRIRIDTHNRSSSSKSSKIHPKVPSSTSKLMPTFLMLRFLELRS